MEESESKMGEIFRTNEFIVLFDGVCNLCNRSVQFLLKHDRKKIFRFGSLQSHTGSRLLGHFEKLPGSASSVVLIEKGKMYTRSTASLRIAKQLGGFWKLAGIFLFVPRFIRDAIYDFIAKRRYRWFGKRNECYLPTPDIKERFLD